MAAASVVMQSNVQSRRPQSLGAGLGDTKESSLLRLDLARSSSEQATTELDGKQQEQQWEPGGLTTLRCRLSWKRLPGLHEYDEIGRRLVPRARTEPGG